MRMPTPHLEKLRAVLENEKLPKADMAVIESAVQQYEKWIIELQAVTGENQAEIVGKMVDLLNGYRLYLDVDVIFDREADFLYRQKGQIKLDNSVLEEFLPHLIYKSVIDAGLAENIIMGPTTTFSSVYFSSSLYPPVPGGGLTVRSKDQDFAIARPLFIHASHDRHFTNKADTISKALFIGYVLAECKTNLDKTMFQEAVATAHDTKSAVTGAKYYLLCEWLDMTPQSTAATDIDEVIILRKQKRLSSNVRTAYGSYAGRQKGREAYRKFLTDNPFRPEMFLRFVNHVSTALNLKEETETNVLQHGYF